MGHRSLAFRTQREESSWKRLSDHVLRFMIAVGKAVKPAMPKGGQLALSEVVVQDRFAAAFPSDK